MSPCKVPTSNAPILTLSRFICTDRAILTRASSKDTFRKHSKQTRSSWYRSGTYCYLPLSSVCMQVLKLYILSLCSGRGVCYHQDSTNQCTNGGGSEDPNRKSILQKFAGVLTGAGIPWLYWQAIPNADPHVRPARRVNSLYFSCHVG